MNRNHGYGITVLAVLLFAGFGFRAAAERESPAPIKPQTKGAAGDTHAVVKLALPYLARQTAEWIEQKKCTSCHQVPHSLWAMNEARGQGFSVDERLAGWNRWSVDFVLAQAEKADGPGERADELYQMLLIGSLADADSDAEAQNRSAPLRDRLLAALRSAQNEDGSWHAGGQLPDQKRTKQETDEVTTMWSLLALRSVGRPNDKQTSRDEPRKDISRVPSHSLEHLALRYLLSTEIGESEQAALQKEILAHQNEDGGWGWLLRDSSDALATGQALYALSHMLPEHGREAVSRGRHFLLRTQQPDGSWQVPSTLLEKANQPYTVSNDWGTAWAVIGLTRTAGQ